MSDEQRCGTCRWFEKEPEWDGGQCRFPMPASVYEASSMGSDEEVNCPCYERKACDGEPVRLPSSDADYPQWAKDIVEAIREVRDELQASERRSR